MSLRADSASGYRSAAIATLAAAVAAITMLSGIVRLRFGELRTTPLLTVEPLPSADWPHTWLGAMKSARVLQAEAVAEWINVVLAMLLALLVFAGVSALIALFAHATARRYENALAAVVGASRAHLTRLQLRKAGANTAVALLAGLPIGLVAAVVANRSWPHAHEDLSAFSWMMLAVVFASALAALVARATARRMAHTGWMGDVLAPEARTNPGYGAEDLRVALLQLQFAFTFAVLAAAVLVWQEARRMLPEDAASAPAQYVTRVAVDDDADLARRRALLARLEAAGAAIASPGVLVGVGATDQVVSNCGPCGFAGMALPLFPLRTQQHVVGAGFFHAAGIPLLRGREFAQGDGVKHYVVVNDTFAHLAFQGQHPIGKTIQTGGLRGTWYTVVGVVRDVPIRGLLSFSPDDRSPVRSNVPGHEPAIYFYAAERPPASFDAVSSAPLSPQLAGLHVVAAQPMSLLLDAARAPARWFAGLLGALGAAAALIAVLSLAALTLLNVRQRELEIAAHRSVGARRRDIMIMVIRSMLATCARGALAGVVVSMAVARAIQMVLPGMKLVSMPVLAATMLALASVALIAAITPARAAARIAPAQIHA